MRRIGNALLWTGVVVGVLSGVWLWFGPRAGDLPWFVGIGLIKLLFAVGLALIATGAVGLRLANRKEMHRLLEGEDPEVAITADRKAARKDAHLRQ
jgi:hypothetical protein